MNTPADSTQAIRRTRERLGLLSLAILFLALTVWSWRKWTDVQIDFGLQLYTPWQLAQGGVLYRDISYIAGGPLSQYFHALLFKVFGASYLVIALANLIIAWLFTWGLFRLFLRAADLFTAVVVGVVVLCVFVFGHLQYIGNFNFITPYTCETVHGLALTVLAIAFAERWVITDRRGWAFGAGLAAGGVFLTKPEVFLALTGALVTAGFVKSASQPATPQARWQNGLAFAGGFAFPLVVFAAYFAIFWPTLHGLGSVAGAWLPLLGRHAGQGQYYAWCLGLDFPLQNSVRLLQYTAALMLVVAALAMAARFFAYRKFVAAGLLWLALAGFLFSPLNKLEWVQGGRALPLLTLAGVAGVAGQWWFTRRERAGEMLVFPLLWSAFALLLLAKLGINARIWQYGFYLALPAAGLLLFNLFQLLPGRLARFDVDNRIFRASLAVFFLVGVVKLVALSNQYYAMKTFAVGNGGDRILAYPEDVNPAGKGIVNAVDWLRANTAERDTLAVLPEGAMVNYLARRTNSVPFMVACPHELQVAGEPVVVAAFAAHPPDRVLLMHRRTAEFGVGYFGAADGYGQDLMGWVKQNYSGAWLLGHEPLVTNQFGMKLFRPNTNLLLKRP